MRRCAEANCLCWHKAVLFSLVKSATEARVGFWLDWVLGAWDVDIWLISNSAVYYALLMFRVGP